MKIVGTYPKFCHKNYDMIKNLLQKIQNYLQMSNYCVPAADRNKEVILEVLKQKFKDTKNVLELGSGTGQHASFFGGDLPYLNWQPSEIDEAYPRLKDGIAYWRHQRPCNNV